MRAAATAVLLALLLTGCTAGEQAGADPRTGPSAESATAEVHAAAQAYVDAVNNQDLAALVECFAPNGKIIDVSRTISGREAIREWARDEVIGGRLRVLSVAEQRTDGQRLLVRWAPAGSSGWRAHYDFTIANDRIITADLQYA